LSMFSPNEATHNNFVVKAIRELWESIYVPPHSRSG
jgi:hypothetical protein